LPFPGKTTILLLSPPAIFVSDGKDRGHFGVVTSTRPVPQYRIGVASLEIDFLLRNVDRSRGWEFKAFFEFNGVSPSILELFS
jgi:hypothetical protein